MELSVKLTGKATRTRTRTQNKRTNVVISLCDVDQLGESLESSQGAPHCRGLKAGRPLAHHLDLALFHAHALAHARPGDLQSICNTGGTGLIKGKRNIKAKNKNS